MELTNGLRMEEAKQREQRGERKDREEGEEAGGSSQWYSRVVEHTPATVGIAWSKTLAAAPILPTGLHRDSGELEQHNEGEAVKNLRRA